MSFTSGVEPVGSPARTVEFHERSPLWSADSALLDLLPVGVYVCGDDGALLRWNRTVVDLWGREPDARDPNERFCGSYRLFRNGRFVPHRDCPMADALRTGQPQRVPEIVIERPDGTFRYVSVTIDSIRNAEGGVVGAVNVVQDMTDRRVAESKARRAEQQFRQLLEKLPAAAYTCNADGLITFFNERAEELWGRRPLLGDPVDKFCGSFRLFTTSGVPIAHDRCWMAVSLRDRRDVLGEEIVVERPDGTRRTALAHASPFHTEQGELAGAVNVLVDITDQVQDRARISELLVREREQSESLREADRRKDEFLAMLGHELRNPLAPIRSGLDILELDADRHHEVIALMQEQLEHVVRLVDDLLDASRVMRGRIELRPEPLELAGVIQRSVAAVEKAIVARRQQLSVALPEEPVWLTADSVRLVQVFENLLTNASKYTDPGGKIDLRAESSNGTVVVSVRDNGVGIDDELLPRVFDLFTQSSRSLDRSQGGLGIGLTLVRRLVELHGGEVRAESSGPGGGSTFVVRLQTMAANGERPSKSGSAPAESRAHRILVVDDNTASGWLLSKLLRKLGDHEIEIAGDGPSALEKFAAFAPDLVVLDIGLPGMSGYDVGRRVRELSPDGKPLLVALTGYGLEEDRRKSAEAGFDLHLVKPPSVDQLRQILDHPNLNRR